MNWLAVSIGGISGVLLRALIVTAAPVVHGISPAVLIVNLLGCGLAGLATGYAEAQPVPGWLVVGFGIGFLGGLTTFSGLILDAFQMVKSGQVITAFIYAVTNFAFGFGLFVVGYMVMSKSN